MNLIGAFSKESRGRLPAMVVMSAKPETWHWSKFEHERKESSEPDKGRSRWCKSIHAH